MTQESRRPSWWQLWLLLPALGILAFLEAGAPLSPAGHTVVEVAIILVIYGLVSVWLRHRAKLCANRTTPWPRQGRTAVYLPGRPASSPGGLAMGQFECVAMLPRQSRIRPSPLAKSWTVECARPNPAAIVMLILFT